MTVLREIVRKSRVIAALAILTPFYVLAKVAVAMEYAFNTGPAARALMWLANRVVGE